MKTRYFIAAFASAALLSLVVPVQAEDKKPEVKPYPLKTCVVSDKDLSDSPEVLTHEGQEIKLCCKKCKGAFDKDPAKYIKKLEKK
jgi:YHS domain-containing protein